MRASADRLALRLAQRDTAGEDQNAALASELGGVLLARADAMAGKQIAPGLQQALVVTAVGAEEGGGGVTAQENDRRRFAGRGQRTGEPEEDKEGADEAGHGHSHSLGE